MYMQTSTLQKIHEGKLLQEEVDHVDALNERGNLREVRTNRLRKPYLKLNLERNQ